MTLKPRIMAEEGVQDFHTAKRKAANRLNQPDMRRRSPFTGSVSVQNPNPSDLAPTLPRIPE